MDNNFQNNEQYYQVSNEFTTENFENSNSESLLPQSEIKYTRDMEIIEVPNFSYDGFRVVPNKYFAHLYEPSFCFNYNKVYFNTACIKKFPNVNYIQFLINPEDKILAIKLFEKEEEMGTFPWCTPKRKPKHITCPVFFGMIMDLMGWNPNNRYKLLGKLIKNRDEYLFLFNLNSFEFYERVMDENSDKPKMSRKPLFPEAWEDRFGLPVDEHRRQLQVNILKDFMVYGYSDKKDKSNVSVELNVNGGNQNE